MSHRNPNTANKANKTCQGSEGRKTMDSNQIWSDGMTRNFYEPV